MPAGCFRGTRALPLSGCAASPSLASREGDDALGWAPPPRGGSCSASLASDLLWLLCFALRYQALFTCCCTLLDAERQ
ncbi:MAG: hypothetical protein E2582_22580 [Delftia sp.]|nr:hypothetical protein [Delftia sp.]